MTSALRGGGRVRKLPNFADKQYVKFGVRTKGGGGGAVKKSQNFADGIYGSPQTFFLFIPSLCLTVSRATKESHECHVPLSQYHFLTYQFITQLSLVIWCFHNEFEQKADDNF